jgi:hypothetical protein
MVHRRRFLILSLANWALAIVLWSISAYLGVPSPTSLFVYAVLFVVALVGVIVGIICGSSGVSGATWKSAPSAARRRPPRAPTEARPLPSHQPGAAWPTAPPSRRASASAGAPSRVSSSRAQRLCAALLPTRSHLASLELPSWQALVWITVAMVAGRSAAMA